MLKRLMKSRIAGKIASFLIGAYIHFVHATSSWTIIGVEQAERAADRGNGVVVVFWHGRLMMAPVMRKQTARRFFMLISAHRDGDIITDSVKSFGLEFIRGSTANPKKRHGDKGGIVASAKMLEVLSEGHIVGMTPDGPRGPRERVQAGAIRIAQHARAPIAPVAVSVSRGRLMKSWDRFLIAWPFSRCTVIVGPVIEPPPENDTAMVESVRQSVENALISLTEEADAMTGLGAHDPHTRESA